MIGVPALRVLLLLTLGSIGGGCLSPSAPPRELDVPFIPQANGHCGDSALGMVLRYYGHDAPLAEISREVHIPVLQGTVPELLGEAAEKRGFGYRLRRVAFADFERFIARGIPLIVLLPPKPDQANGHFVVLTGYRPDLLAVRIHSGAQSHRWMLNQDIESEWGPGPYPVLIVYPKTPVHAPSRGGHVSLPAGFTIFARRFCLSNATRYDSPAATGKGEIWDRKTIKSSC
jgi:ABC-type bacteriocin/lantibiotic exporter with double-glycine peptidase domain